MGRLLASSLVVASCCALASGAAAAKKRPLQHVTIFGDSVAAALTWDPTAREVLARGNRLTLDLAPCGRLTQPGCVSPPPPSVLKEVRLLGRRIGPTAVVLVGYNDDPHVYAAGIGQVLKAMRRRGVTNVLWLTLRAVNQQYRLVNEVIHGASARFPWMTVLDWNAYSRNRPSWFATDGIHLSALGGVQLARFIHGELKLLGLTGPPRAG
ncbi:MAG: hypothetical protein ACJ75G_01970 [Gaiellaceae bacterium]